MQVDTIDERLALFRRMLEHAGFDPDDSGIRDRELLAAAQRCLGCRAAEECRSWLKDVPADQSPPGFCRNVEHFTDWTVEAMRTELAELNRAIGRLEADSAR